MEYAQDLYRDFETYCENNGIFIAVDDSGSVYLIDGGLLEKEIRLAVEADEDEDVNAWTAAVELEEGQEVVASLIISKDAIYAGGVNGVFVG